MTRDLLTTAVAAAKRAAEERERVTPLATLEAALDDRRPNGEDFVGALTAPGVRVVAECKRRSPSRGVLVPSYDPVALAQAYEAGGAAALSVLTEPTFFDGSLDHLRAVRRVVRLPVLRKDFVITAYQVFEAAAAGADAVLLIVAALTPAALRRLLTTATGVGLAALVEVHDREELSQALDAGATLVGVNSRNLRTLHVNRGLFEVIASSIPRHVVTVAESGLSSAEDLARLHELRYDAFLVGERLLSADDPRRALALLLEGSGGERQD